jgi:hypothetical protein
VTELHNRSVPVLCYTNKQSSLCGPFSLAVSSWPGGRNTRTRSDIESAGACAQDSWNWVANKLVTRGPDLLKYSPQRNLCWVPVAYTSPSMISSIFLGFAQGFEFVYKMDKTRDLP